MKLDIDRVYINDILSLQLYAFGIPKGSIVLVHSSMRAVGKVKGGAEGLLNLLIKEIAQYSQFQFYAKTVFLQMMLVLHW